MWVTARYLWHWKCQCKCEKGRYNVAQKIQTLLPNNDQNAVAVFSIYIEDYVKAKVDTSRLQVLNNFYW